jgi:hypothetical protein
MHSKPHPFRLSTDALLQQRHEGTTTTFFTEAAQHFTLLEVRA